MKNLFRNDVFDVEKDVFEVENGVFDVENDVVDIENGVFVKRTIQPNDQTARVLGVRQGVQNKE